MFQQAEKDNLKKHEHTAFQIVSAMNENKIGEEAYGESKAGVGVKY